MQRFPLFLLLSLTLISAGNAAYLPVVDVSGGAVSARAAFGKEVMLPLFRRRFKKKLLRAVQKRLLPLTMLLRARMC